MGRYSVYIPEKQEELLKQAMEYGGDSTSGVIIKALEIYVSHMEDRYKGIEEKIILDGTIDHRTGEIFGRKVKFYGKELASIRTREVGPEAVEHQTLYLTKKGKYILETTIFDKSAGEESTTFEVCHSLDDLRQKANADLLVKAGKTAGEFLEELDV